LTPESARVARLGLLQQRSNSRSDIDYVVALDGSMRDGGGHGRCRVRLTYVPDKLLLDAGAFTAYLAAFDEGETAPIETLALAILDDIGNEIVPRWAQVVVSQPHGAAGAGMQCVIVEERQPNWDNARILARLPGALSPDPGGDGD
jgi:hypothetical protein